MTKGKIISSLLSLIFILCVSYIAKTYQLPESATLAVQDIAPTVALPMATESAVITRIIDGDTVQIATGEKVRLIGIDTPETVDPRKGVQCFGKKASDHTKEILLNKEVTLKKDISITDRYGRLLRYIYVGDTFINEQLVRDGYAKASSYPPDIRYQEVFLEAQKYSQENSLGLWGECY